jgi:SAM-dependent methyltransferase
MATHQSIGGGTDEELLQRMVQTHAERYGDAFWSIFSGHVLPRLPAAPVVVDLGCGPGLFLRDVAQRQPAASLHGYDVTAAMIAYAERLPWPGAPARLALHDVARAPLPHAAGSVDLVAMTSVLHVFDEPLPVLAEIRRVLAPGGTFLLYDWIRQSLEAYLRSRREMMGEGEPETQGRSFRLFAVHNKYTPADWRWLLARAGFTIRHHAQMRESHQVFVAAPAPEAPGAA